MSELIEFLSEDDVSGKRVALDRPWKILVVDDDAEVHQATAFALNSLPILGRPIEILNAYSAREALSLLRHEADVAVVLLDVVMESPTAGLEIISAIRNELCLTSLRIVLRTGQPGYAPEIETIQRYDINDYKTKSELTRTKLFTTLSAALRAYDQICRVDFSRGRLEEIVLASRRLLTAANYDGYLADSLTQVAAFLGVPPDGVICTLSESGDMPTVIAGTGRYQGMSGRRLEEVAPTEVVPFINRCHAESHGIYGQHGFAFCLSGADTGPLVGYQHLPETMEVDNYLLDVFSNSIAVGAEKMCLLDRLHAAAYTDTLTGLPNRTALIEELEHRCSIGTQCQNILALIDIDQFSAINDMFGHAYADQLLRSVAHRLTAGLANSCYVSRVGNDTFAVFGEKDIVHPDVLRPLFAAPYLFDDVEHAVSVSMGAVHFEGGAVTSGADALKDASIALKRAKMNGHGQDAWFTAAAGEETREHARLLHALRHAFRMDRLFLVYQPQIDLGSGRVIGVEALLRWRGEDGLYISPDRFIPLAESSGLIVDLGEWVLRMALRAAAELQLNGFPRLSMAVNVSAPQFAHPNFLAMLDKALAASEIPPELVELEITESVALLGADSVARLLQGVKQRGISIAIDDFGTGYSSLSYLDRLPADRIKIDRSFVNALHAGERGARIAEMVIPLGNQLGLRVLAEGIETAEQAARLRQLGCHEAQGYLYARPMPLPDLLVWLSERKPQ
ncbi:MAG: EAL domain-containing protein [Pseudomonadota bacterium]